eukprot:4785449-Pleurochrysis_carterae.AAC.1
MACWHRFPTTTDGAASTLLPHRCSRFRWSTTSWRLMAPASRPRRHGLARVFRAPRTPHDASPLDLASEGFTHKGLIWLRPCCPSLPRCLPLLPSLPRPLAHFSPFSRRPGRLRLKHA